MAVTEYSTMPLAERVRAYRALAEATRRQAERCNGVARDTYLMIAEQWHRLAADIDSYLDVQGSEALWAKRERSEARPHSRARIADRQ